MRNFEFLYATTGGLAFIIFYIPLLLELQAEQILTGSRTDLSEKVGAESRADTKLLQFFAFFAVFMPFLYRYWNKRAVIVDQRAEQTSLI